MNLVNHFNYVWNKNLNVSKKALLLEVVRNLFISSLLYNQNNMSEIIVCAICSNSVAETRTLSILEIKECFKKVTEKISGWKILDRCEPALINEEGTQQLRCNENYWGFDKEKEHSIEDIYYHPYFIEGKEWRCLFLGDNHEQTKEGIHREEKINLAEHIKWALQLKLEHYVHVEIIQRIDVEDLMDK